MIVDDLDVEAVPVAPEKADSPLIIDADAVLSRAFAFQCLEAVSWRNPEVGKGFGGVQHDELSKSDPMQFRREPPGPVPVEEAFRLMVTEAPDHEVIITEPVKAVKERCAGMSGRLDP
jgi:hypothetical protein